MILNAPLASDYLTGLGAINANTILDYCAQSANSYPGSVALWQNINQYDSPANPSPQSSGPLFPGNPGVLPSAAMPFVGLAGQPGAYWSQSSTYYFVFSGRSNTTPKVAAGLWANIHKTTGGQDFTICMMILFRATGQPQTLFCTKASDGNQGVIGFVGSLNHLTFSQGGDTGTSTSASTFTLVDNTTYIIFIGHDGTANKSHISIYDHAGTLLQASTPNHTYNATSTAPTTGLSFGVTFDAAESAATGLWAQGTKIYAIAGFNAALSSGDMTTLASTISGRAGV